MLYDIGIRIIFVIKNNLFAWRVGMANVSWTWKGKDGSRGRLLYEPGNWGDLLKLVWLEAFFSWHIGRPGSGFIEYLDPFAGAVDYPLGKRSGNRFHQAELAGMRLVRETFLDHGRWPSSAMVVKTLFPDVAMTIFDADPERLESWSAIDGATCAGVASGWELLETAVPGSDALWLVDPYDFIAEWRERLPLLEKIAGKATLFVYIYNRAARGPEAFAEYRAFRNALDDSAAFAGKRIGRVASDAFLPRAHHEVLFLPSRGIAEDRSYSSLVSRLEEAVTELGQAVFRAGAFDY